MLNEVRLIGNLGRDPEIRKSTAGEPIASFSIATSERWKDKTTGEKRERTEWHNVVVFGPLAAIVEKYAKKGSKLYVAGQLRTRKWQDQSGADRWSTEVVLSGFNATLLLLGDASGGGQRDYSGYEGGPSAGSTGGAATGGQVPADLDDDVPF